MRFDYGETITVLRPGGYDRNGDPLPGSEHTVEECAIYPTSMDEAAAGISIDADYTLLGPFGADILADDVVYREADTARVEPLYVGGVSWDVKHPMTGWEPGCQVYLKYRTGGLAYDSRSIHS